eukprot:GHRQ01017553.1.p1 GENE.GHRQ01017553.1~~GHRQ01017553.1.p1  ORF type:complete len:157 (-),score=28.98 GHRQ01017553.1:236-706(-)
MAPLVAVTRSSCKLQPAAAPLYVRGRRTNGIHRASAATCMRLARRGAVTCRADVNSDAFRSPYENPYREFLPVRSSNSRSVRQFDYLVLGSGIAGLSYALKVAEYGSVAIITKDYANEGCTQYAQGGVCAVLDKADSVDSHVEDTMVAGAFLNDRK